MSLRTRMRVVWLLLVAGAVMGAVALIELDGDPAGVPWLVVPVGLALASAFAMGWRELLGFDERDG